MFPKSLLSKHSILAIAAVLASGVALGATFGKVVAIGGQAADLVLDEVRGVLYVADFTANRIDVVSLTTKTVKTSINLSPGQPSSISISPDDRWLIVAQYGASSTGSQTNAFSLIDLTNNYARTTFALGNAPLGVAFGIDNKALIVTTNEFFLFDPAVGSTQLLETIPQVATNAIPQPPASFPLEFTQASIAVSRDGSTIAGFGGTSPYLLFRYTVANKTIAGSFYTSTPQAGPRVVSLSDDGSLMSFGWWVMDSNFITTAEFPNPSGLLSVGSHVIDSSRNLVYAQVPQAGTPQNGNTSAPILDIRDSDNLTLREQVQLPENLAGKSVLTKDHNTMYSVSASGVTVLPVGSLNAYPRLAASAEDVVFRGNFCNRSSLTQTLTISDPGGNRTPFTITPGVNGIGVSPSSGVTPAVVTVAIDPNVFAGDTGTVLSALSITSATAIDAPQSVRVVINSAAPYQRGTSIDIPGVASDLMADPKRPAYYVTRQDKNQVLVFNSQNNTQTAILRTCTKPTSMAITTDQQYLLVGCDNSHYLSVFDLDLLQAQAPVTFQSDYVESVATSSNAILAVTRSAADGTYGIDQVYLGQQGAGFRYGARLPQLGVWQNGKLPKNTILASSPNGAHILVAGSDGTVMIYDAVAGTFTVSRNDFTSLSGSAGASNFDQYVVANHLLDFSGAPQLDFQTPGGSPAGFAFVSQSGYFTMSNPSVSASGQNGPGTIAQVDLSTGNLIVPTAMVEAPLLGDVTIGLGNFPGLACTTVTGSGGTTTTQTCSSTVGGVTTVTVLACNGVGASTSNCQTTTTSGPANTTVSGLSRTMAPLPDQSAIINLTTSGVTILPWSFAASVALPLVSNVVSAADGQSPPAPGGLIEILGSQFSPTNLATTEIPLPTALADSCVTINGQPMPLIFVSPNQINAQMPSAAVGDVTLQIYTPGGVSDNFNLTVPPTAPAVFLTGTAGPLTDIPTVVRDDDNLLVTDSNPVHRGDTLTIYLTGCGQTSPLVGDGQAAPMSPLSLATTQPTVQIGGVTLSTSYAGLAPGQVGVCQINATVPSSVPLGLSVPLTITQGSGSQSVGVRVID